MDEKRYYRVYVDVMGNDGPVWSVDEGDISTEMRFKHVRFERISGMDEHFEHADNVNEPKCWFKVWGTLEIRGENAILTGE